MSAVQAGRFFRGCWRPGGPLIVGGGFLLLTLGNLDQFTNGYTRYLFAVAACYTLAVLSVSELSARAGIVSFGHAGFVGLGAYVGAELAEHGAPLELAIVIVALLAFCIGAAVGSLATRFSVLYFSIITFALGLSVEELIGGLRSYTGGSNGRPMPPMQIALIGRALDEQTALIVAVVIACGGLMLAGGVQAVRGPRWLAIKEDRLAAAAIGIDARRELAWAFAYGAVLPCVGGLVLASVNGFLVPQAFSLQLSLYFVAAAILGGTGSRFGAVIGASFLVAAPELIRHAPGMSPSNAGNVQIIIFGILIVSALVLLPEGVVPGLADRFGRLWRPHARPAESSPEPTTAELAAFVRPSDAELSVTALTVRYGGVVALEAVDLHVAARSTVGVIGPNGAGKTTLLNALTGLTRAAATPGAAISYGGIDLLRMPPEERVHHGLARTFQHARLFPSLTVAETVRLSAQVSTGRELEAEEVERLLRGLGLTPWTSVRGADLPFSVQAMADIARALASSPSILILDEPFGGLDRAESARLQSVLQTLHQCGMTLLIVDHVVSEIFSIADRLVVLTSGRVMRSGSVDEIRRSADVADAYLGRRDW